MQTVTVLSLVSIMALSAGWANRQSFSPLLQLPRWYSRHTCGTRERKSLNLGDGCCGHGSGFLDVYEGAVRTGAQPREEQGDGGTGG